MKIIKNPLFWSGTKNQVSSGAVLRAIGSKISGLGCTPISRHCSATKNRCSALATTIGVTWPSLFKGRKRSKVSWKRDFLSVNDKNCFGRIERDKGQRRDPEPPHNITGMIISLFAMVVITRIPREDLWMPSMCTRYQNSQDCLYKVSLLLKLIGILALLTPLAYTHSLIL